MSRYSFQSSTSAAHELVNVTCGYTAGALDEFFLHVTSRAGTLFDSLAERPLASAEAVLSKLSDLGLVVPEDLGLRLEMRERNVIRRYRDGRWTEEA